MTTMQATSTYSWNKVRSASAGRIEEYKNFFKDIARSWRRLKTHQYAISSFNTNMLNIPSRTADFFTELDFYRMIGKAWEQLFSGEVIAKAKKVTEFCPGYYAKVGLGLHYAGFTGILTAVDADKKSLDRMVRMLKLFDVSFQTNAAVADIYHSENESSNVPRADVVVGNHIFDDLLLWEICSLKKVNLNIAYRDETMMRKLWNDISDVQSEIIPGVAKKFFLMLEKYVDANGKAVFLHYESYFERSLKFDLPQILSFKLMEEVARVAENSEWKAALESPAMMKELTNPKSLTLSR